MGNCNEIKVFNKRDLIDKKKMWVAIKGKSTMKINKRSNIKGSQRKSKKQ